MTISTKTEPDRPAEPPEGHVSRYCGCEACMEWRSTVTVANRITLEDGPIKLEILDMHPDWAFEVMVAAQDGEPVITHLQICPHPDTDPSDGDGVPINGLTATVMRRLSFSDIRRRALNVLSPLFRTASDGTQMVSWYKAESGSQPTPRSTAST